MSKEDIDYIDIEISLSGLPVKLFKTWLNEFIQDKYCIRPEIKKGILYINSQDLVLFLSYINAAEISEIALQRFKVRAVKELKRMLFNALQPDHQYHYKWCLAAFKNASVGNKVKKQDVSSEKELKQTGEIKVFKLKDTR